MDTLGGTGKTFLNSLILSTILSHNEIVLTLSSSGIVATWSEGGQTAHLVLKLPFNIESNIFKNSAMAKFCSNVS